MDILVPITKLRSVDKFIVFLNIFYKKNVAVLRYPGGRISCSTF